MTVRLILRAVQLELHTSDGVMGTTLLLTRGLNILRADNSSGKSTVLQSIVYGLGLEGMLSARRDIPLPHSMTDRVSVGDREVAVAESFVRIEFENDAGEIVTVKRQVKHPAIDTGLVQVWSGSGIMDGDQSHLGDFFVRRAGAAVRAAGFHHFLAEFAGWHLPLVTQMDGSERPLYLESLFPYFYVEQKHGWSGVQARLPTYLGIRDIGKRSAEYILRLDYFERVLLRQRLASAASEITAAWDKALDELRRSAQTAGLILSSGPARPQGVLEDHELQAQMHDGTRWLAADAAAEQLSQELRRLRSTPIRSVGERAEELEKQLLQAQAGLERDVAAYNALMSEQQDLLTRRNQLESRIEALEEDLQRHKDSITLNRLGSQQEIAAIAEHVCPTCHQDLIDGSDVASHVMTAAENVLFIQQQLETFRAMYGDVDRVVTATVARLAAQRGRIAEERSAVRATKSALLSGNETPSIADVAQLAGLESRVDALELEQGEIQRWRQTLVALSENWAENRRRYAELGTEGLSERDVKVITLLEGKVRVQLRRYDFKSLRPEDVEINRDTYRPANEGFDLGFDISASDMIRVIWAYLISMLTVSREMGGNHAGFLIFDEPRQQETARASYQALLQQAAEDAASGAQILFATSEPSEDLRSMLGSAQYSLTDVPPGEKLLRPMS